MNYDDNTAKAEPEGGLLMAELHRTYRCNTDMVERICDAISEYDPTITPGKVISIEVRAGMATIVEASHP